MIMSDHRKGRVRRFSNMKKVAFVFLFISLALNGCIFKTQRVATPLPNDALESKIQSKLKNDPLTAPWEIKSKVEGNTVVLSGLVDTEEERQRAEELTRSVVGELRRVDNNLVLTSEVILDNSIVSKLKNDLVSDPLTRQANINVQSHKGVVVLEGKVQTGEQRREAETLASNIDGVKRVENNLKVQG